MGKAITTLIVLALIIAGGIWMFNRGDNDLALDGNGNVTTTDENLTGTGGPDDGFDPLEDLDQEEDENSKG